MDDNELNELLGIKPDDFERTPLHPSVIKHCQQIASVIPNGQYVEICALKDAKVRQVYRLYNNLDLDDLKKTLQQNIWGYMRCEIEDCSMYVLSGSCRQQSGYRVRDADIENHLFLLIDVDTIKYTDEKKRCSSNWEKTLSELYMEICLKVLQQKYNLSPENYLLVDSGNGYQIQAYINRMSDDIKFCQVLEFIEQKVNGIWDVMCENWPHDNISRKPARIDQVCGNRARLMRLAGTVNAKGQNTDARPHRWTALCHRPKKLVPWNLSSILCDFAKWDRPVKEKKSPVTPRATVVREKVEKNYIKKEGESSVWDEIRENLPLEEYLEQKGVSISRGRSCCWAHGGDNETAMSYLDNIAYCHTQCRKAYNVIDAIQVFEGLDIQDIPAWAESQGIISKPVVKQYTIIDDL